MRFLWGDFTLKHFIITRFGYQKDYEYLEKRIALFNRFTLPSIKAQTNQNFEWLLLGEPLFDIPRATWLGHQPDEQLRAGRMNNNEYLKYIRRATKNEDMVLMTRLDNDDILMPSFVEDLQEAVKPPGIRGSIIDFRGYRLDLSRKGGATFGQKYKFYKDIIYNKDFTSPMITMVQTTAKIALYRHNHARTAKYFPVMFIEKPNWVQVIHRYNWLMAAKQTRLYSERLASLHPFVKELMEGYDATNC